MPLQTLKQIGPCLTSELSKYLRDEYQISASAARKRIQRGIDAGTIKVLKPINFAHGQKFVYLHEHTGTRLYYERLFSALAKSRSVYRLALAAMRARGGTVTERMFPVVSGRPLESKFKQDSVDIKQALLDLGFLEKDGECLHLANNEQQYRLSTTQLEARIQTENSLLVTFADWLQKQRLIGNQMTFRFNENVPQAGHYQWDFVAPSYVAPLASREKGKATPGFIVADVILGRVITQHEVQFFIEKCSNIRIHKNNRPFMAFLVADWFEQEALNLAQSHGVIFTTPKSLFGKNFAEALEEFRKILEEKNSQIAEQAQKISELIKKTNDLDFADEINENLRGRLFELVVAHCCSKLYPGTIVLGKKFQDKNDPKKYWDCDILQTVTGTSLRACECKANRKKSKVDIVEAKKWFRTVVPLIRDTYKPDDYRNQEFSIWTCGEFDEDALQWITSFSQANGNFKVSYKSANDLAKIVEEVGDPAIKDAYNRWFKPLIDSSDENAA